jgi:hypothetical protein
MFRKQRISKIVLSAIFLFATVAFAADTAIDRWANAVGGRERISAIKSVYREATVEYAGMQGTIKVWHTADGKYRKEERISTYSLIETFDGVNGASQQGDAPPHKMTPAEIEVATSRRFGNANAMFFAFFPERRRGSVDIEADGTIVLKPEGGVEWRVTLDPQTSLPKTMVHQEGNQTITVNLGSYQTIDGIKFETEIHRSAGDPTRGAVIHFTKTVINSTIDPSLFSIATK